jgi:hypothetical protein
MPTTRKRHTITETPPVEQALDELREIAGAHVDFAELVVLGARTKAATLRSDQTTTRELRERLATRILLGEIPIDPGAVREVRRTGWARS